MFYIFFQNIKIVYLLNKYFNWRKTTLVNINNSNKARKLHKENSKNPLSILEFADDFVI